MGPTDATVEPPSRDDAPEIDDRRLSRRKMIRAAGIAGAAAWTAPVIIDSLSSPAAAATCPQGNFAYVVLYSPPGSNGQLLDRPGGDSSGGSGTGPRGTCDFTGPGTDCLHTNGGVRSTAAGIGLIIVPTNISHNITQLSQAAVVLSLAATSCCVITNVKAHVHRFGAATGTVPPNDCPDSYCQPATTNGPYLQLTAGAYNTRSVTVRPNLSTTACDNPNQSVHWGSPNQDDQCQAAAGENGYANGQPFGYMLIELNCTGHL